MRQRRTLGAAAGGPPSGPDVAPIAPDSGNNVPLGYLEPETVPIPVITGPVMTQPALDGVASAGLLLEPETIPIPVVTDPVDAGGYRANGGDSARAHEWLGSVLSRVLELPGLAGELRGSLVRRRAMFSQRLGLYLIDELVTASHWLRAHLTDEWAVAILAALLSIAFFAWYDTHGLTVAFNDARIRELIARRVLMGRTPGLAQLGTTWLPLPFLLMLPLIWNDTLFRDGIAGAIPSMLAYVLAVVYLYRTARLLTSYRSAGWVAATALALNPSLLYMQSTPMSETASLSAFVIAVYYALRLTRTYDALDVVKCASAAAAGTLIRYENWVFAISFTPILVYVAWRRRGYTLAQAWAILYALLAFAGCAAWIIYNAVIFHDPFLSFFYGNRSHTYYAHAPASLLPARHHPLIAFDMYGLTVAETTGWALVAMALIGITVYVARTRLHRTTLPVYLFFLPFAFYWLVLYRGANTESLGIAGLGTGPLYNLRFGLLMIPAAAVFLNFPTVAVPARVRRATACLTLALIVTSSISGIAGTSIVLGEALHGAQGAGTEEGGRADAAWLSRHYRGGNVLITYGTVNNATMIFYLLTAHRFPDRALITDANSSQFTAALAEPQRWATWIVMDSDASNGASKIWTTLHRRNDWQRYFSLRMTSGTTRIYSRRPAPVSVPRRPLLLPAVRLGWKRAGISLESGRPMLGIAGITPARQLSA